MSSIWKGSRASSWKRAWMDKWLADRGLGKYCKSLSHRHSRLNVQVASGASITVLGKKHLPMRKWITQRSRATSPFEVSVTRNFKKNTLKRRATTKQTSKSHQHHVLSSANERKNAISGACRRELYVLPETSFRRLDRFRITRD